MNKVETISSQTGRVLPSCRLHVRAMIDNHNDAMAFADAIRGECESNPTVEGKRIALLKRLESNAERMSSTKQGAREFKYAETYSIGAEVIPVAYAKLADAQTCASIETPDTGVDKGVDGFGIFNFTPNRIVLPLWQVK